MRKRSRTKQIDSLQERLAEFARGIRAKIKSLPPEVSTGGLKRLRSAETAEEWVSSPGGSKTDASQPHSRFGKLLSGLFGVGQAGATSGLRPVQVKTRNANTKERHRDHAHPRQREHPKQIVAAHSSPLACKDGIVLDRDNASARVKFGGGRAPR
jgi:hypothetical protein